MANICRFRQQILPSTVFTILWYMLIRFKFPHCNVFWQTFVGSGNKWCLPLCSLHFFPKISFFMQDLPICIFLPQISKFTTISYMRHLTNSILFPFSCLPLVFLLFSHLFFRSFLPFFSSLFLFLQTFCWVNLFPIFFKVVSFFPTTNIANSEIHMRLVRCDD